MADDKTKQGPADRGRINVNEDYEVAYWTDALGVTREELEAAVKKVGTASDAVRTYFNK
jgi:hypothetical protein